MRAAIAENVTTWITLRTCDSSVIHMRAICGTLINVFQASRIDARCLVDATFDCFDKHPFPSNLFERPH